MNEKEFLENGLHFSCTQCAKCCCGTPGVVFLEKHELKALAKHEELTEEEFIKVFCRCIVLDDGSKLLSLRENSKFECIFWKENAGCSVYPLRPVQCRTYPFWSNVLKDEENWNKEKERCPGINEGELFTKEKILEDLHFYESRNIISEH